MKTTEWKLFDGGKSRIRATYGMRKLGEQEPYFSITGEIQFAFRRGWREGECVCIHEAIVKHFPDLAPLIRWHLCFELKGPMHYEANALYHLGIGQYSELNMDHFRSIAVFGALSDDDSTWAEVEKLASGHAPTTTRAEALKPLVIEWLRCRLPRLMDAFRADMKKAGVT